MPEYDDSFLLDCEKLERKKWRSYSVNRGVREKFFKNRLIKNRKSYYGFLDEKSEFLFFFLNFLFSYF